MMKYEEEHYLYENIKDKIYPWVKESLVDHKALKESIFLIKILR